MPTIDSSEHFSRAELQCRCGCGRADMDVDFMVWLELVRHAYGKPMRLSSAFRCPEHNAKVSSTGRHGPHTTGKAVDVLISGPDAHELMAVAFDLDVCGIGVSQKGTHESRFVHLDMIEGGKRPWTWSY